MRFNPSLDGELVKREPKSTDFLENDDIPETLFPILKRICTEMELNMEEKILQIQDFSNKVPDGGPIPKPFTKV